MFQTAVGTNHNLKVAWFQHIFQLAVVEFQQVVGNLELHYLAFALLQVNALKALQLFYGAGDAGHHIVDVQLHNLVGIVVAGIGNRFADIDKSPEISVVDCLHPFVLWNIQHRVVVGSLREGIVKNLSIGILYEHILKPSKACFPMVVMLFGIETAFNRSHIWNDWSLMLVTSKVFPSTVNVEGISIWPEKPFISSKVTPVTSAVWGFIQS